MYLYLRFVINCVSKLNFNEGDIMISKIKVAISTINENCSINKDNIIWDECTVQDIQETIRYDNPYHNKVALLYSEDIDNKGITRGTREQFESDPVTYGVAMYMRKDNNHLIYE